MKKSIFILFISISCNQIIAQSKLHSKDVFFTKIENQNFIQNDHNDLNFHFYQISQTKITEIFMFPNEAKSNQIKPRRNKILTVTSFALMLSGGFFTFQSFGSEQNYLDYKNDILYSSNNFTQQELSIFEEERKELKNKACWQRIVGPTLLTGGVITFGIHLNLNNWSFSDAFLFKDDSF